LGSSFWAPHFGKNIREQAEKMEVRDMRYTQPEALEKIEFLLSLDTRKLAYLERRGTEKQKEAIRRAMLEEGTIKDELKRLKQEYDRLLTSPTATLREKERAKERYVRAQENLFKLKHSPVFNVDKRIEKLFEELQKEEGRGREERKEKKGKGGDLSYIA